MTKGLAGLQYVKTLEDLYREGDPDIGPLKFDNTAGIKAINNVFCRRNQEELDDSADAQLFEAFRTLQNRNMAGNTGVTEDQARMIETRRSHAKPSCPHQIHLPPRAPWRETTWTWT